MAFGVSREQGLAEVGAGEAQLVARMVERWGRVTLVVPHAGQRDLVRRGLARHGIENSVDTMTASAWVEGLWELFGTGERLVNALDRRLIMSALVRECAGSATLAPLKDNPGTVDMLCVMAQEVLPYLDVASHAPGLSASEERSCDLLQMYADRLAEQHLIEPALAYEHLSTRFSGFLPACARCAVLRSPRTLSASQLNLLDCIGAQGDVHALFDSFGLPLALQLAERWGCGVEGDNVPARNPWSGHVAFAPAAGPAARLDAVVTSVAACVEDAHARGVKHPRIAIAAPDPLGAYRDLAPRLAVRGVSAAVHARMQFGQSRMGQQLVSLRGLLDRIEHAEASAWWPAPELADWVRSPLSGMGEGCDRAAVALDTQLRKKRSISAEGLRAKLASMQSREQSAERDRAIEEGRSPRPVVVKQVIDALDRGAVGHALGLMGQACAQADPERFGVEGLAARDAELAMVGAASGLFRRARALHLPAEVAVDALDSLSVRIDWSFDVDLETTVADAVVCRLDEAAQAGPGAFDACILMDASAGAYPLTRRESASDLLARKLGCARFIQAASAQQRSAFAGVLACVRGLSVLSYVAHDAGSDELYPAMSYAEVEQDARDREAYACVSDLVGEDCLFRIVDPAGGAGALRSSARCRGSHELGAAVTQFVQPRCRVVAGEVRPRLLSASQMENYLSCPYRWFVSNRVPTRMLDAGFGPIEFGNFAHDVMQRFHERLIECGLNRVTPDTVDACLEQMDCAFDEMREDHARGKYAHGKYSEGASERPRAIRGALVALDELERSQIDAMRMTFHAVVRYESDLMPLYTPCEFEYSFDKEGVEYAGRPLGGRIDRIDVAPSAGSGERFVVIDYKNRSGMGEFACPDPSMYLSGFEELEEGWLPGWERDKSPKVQTLMYATAYERLSHGQAQGAVYMGLRGPCMAGAVSSALTECEPSAFPHDRLSAYPGCSKGARGAEHDGSLELSDLLGVVERSIAGEIERMESGDIEPSPASDSCAYCPLTMCEKRR